MKEIYYILNESRFCQVKKWHGDMASVVYCDDHTESLGDIHKSRLIKVKKA